MWPAQAPTFSIADVLPICTADIRDSRLRDRLGQDTALINDRSDTFSASIASGDVHCLVPHDYILPNVDKTEMAEIYSKNLVQGGGRQFYEAIRDSADWCPACNHDEPDEVDHYLPKSQFPALALTPENLVPLCRKCNRKKLQRVAVASGRRFMHPYTESMETVLWLAASIERTPQPHIRFHRAPGRWVPDTAERIDAHMEYFKLNRHYGAQAARVVAQSRHTFGIHLESAGPQAVRAEAEKQLISHREDQLNSWQAAMWDALSKDEWFCAGGFRDIGRHPKQ